MSIGSQKIDIEITRKVGVLFLMSYCEQYVFNQIIKLVNRRSWGSMNATNDQIAISIDVPSVYFDKNGFNSLIKER